MENGKKIRNHISIIAEQVGGGFATLAVVAFGILIQNVDKLMEVDFSFAEAGRGMMIIVGILLFFIIAVVKQIWTWAKTWIYIEGQTIVIERKTVNQKVNTIGIKNISNINTEQNLFEMIVGTCKIKIDTSSLSTAEKTDVQIVLKKADAEAFRQTVMGLLKEAAGNRDNEEKSDINESNKVSFDTEASLSDILKHGFCSITIFSLLVIVVGVGGLIEVISHFAEKGQLAQSLVSGLVGILAVLSFILSAVWNIVKDFIRYFEFSAQRKGDEIYIRYGILKRVEYTIPVDKIQALKINQTLIARMAGMYMAELINIGIGDDKEEKQSFFILYGKKKDVEEKIEKLLPEFAGAAQEKMIRQPVSVLAVKAVPLVFFEAALILGAMALLTFWGKYKVIVTAVAAFTGVFIPLLIFLDYLTARICVDEGFLRTVGGYFGKTLIAVKYDKIQYVELRQSFLARLCRIQKGSFSLLAAAGMREHDIPYFQTNLEEKIKEKILGH